MTDESESNVSTTGRLVTRLRELISALDRRVPHVERPGEIRIARDSQTLRRDAVALIEALGRRGPDDNPYDEDLVLAIMSDDGGATAAEACGLR